MNSGTDPHSPPAAIQPNSTPPRKALVGVGVLVLILIVLAAIGMIRRSHNATVLAEHTDESAPPTVNVALPRLGSPTTEFVLPGNVTAFTESPIYARTDGYLLHWYYDIGANVKKGDLLAEIATPELDQQLHQAEQDLAGAQANAKNAQINATRYSDLVKSDAVSRQDTDTYVNQAMATEATVHSAEANVQRLKELQSFEKIYAPFDGVITARTVDIGQLINQGAGTELFHMQALNALRVYTNVPQVFSESVKPGMKVTLAFPEHPGKIFSGTLVRTADAIDSVSRTLLVEIDIDNGKGGLMPGSLAQVHFRAPPVAQSMIVPAAAVIFRAEGLRVGTVTKDSKGNTVAHLVPVTIGEDDGATEQIISGLNPGDQVIQDPSDSLVEGQRVKIVHPVATPASSNSADQPSGGI